MLLGVLCDPQEWPRRPEKTSPGQRWQPSEFWASDFCDGTAKTITTGSPSANCEDSNAPAKPFAVIPPTAAQRMSLEPFAKVTPMAAGQNSDQDAKEDNPQCKSELHAYLFLTTLIWVRMCFTIVMQAYH